MTSRRTRLLTATATAALLSMTASGAMAFDDVNWTWNKLVSEDVVIDIDITTDIDPDGLVQVEKLQMHFGDVNAVAHVTDIDNNAGTEPGEGGVVSIDETFVWNPVNYNSINGNFPCDQNAVEGPCTLVSQDGVNDGDSALTATLLPTGDINENDNQIQFEVQVTGEVTVPSGEGLVLDALDLPKIENAATAVANNQSITSDVPIYLHDAQFAAGGFNDFSDADTPEIIQGVVGLLAAGLAFEEYADGNIHTALALGMSAAAAGGVVEPATINANATVSDILNAYVDNSSTAVANNASFTIESDDINNNVIVADLTQWAYADVNANAQVWAVDLNGYTNFSGAGMGGGGDITPIVSNVATAVGNNLNINVGTAGAPAVNVE